MDIWFRCGHCGKSLVADEKGRGYSINCPDCGTALVIPDASTETPGSEDVPIQPLGAGASQPEKPKLQLKRNPNAPRMKACPYCAEEIIADAIKCKHCGTMLDEIPSPAHSLAGAITARPDKRSRISREPARLLVIAKRHRQILRLFGWWCVIGVPLSFVIWVLGRTIPFGTMFMLLYFAVAIIGAYLQASLAQAISGGARFYYIASLCVPFGFLSLLACAARALRTDGIRVGFLDGVSMEDVAETIRTGEKVPGNENLKLGLHPGWYLVFSLIWTVWLTSPFVIMSRMTAEHVRPSEHPDNTGIDGKQQTVDDSYPSRSVPAASLSGTSGQSDAAPLGNSPSEWPSVTSGSCLLKYDDHYNSIFAGKVAAYINQIWTNWYVSSEWTNGVLCLLTYEEGTNVVSLFSTPDMSEDEGLLVQLEHDNGEIAEVLFHDQVVRLQLFGPNTSGELVVYWDTSTDFYSFVRADNGSLVYRHPVTRAQARALVSLMTPTYYNGEQYRMMGLSFIDGRYFVEIEVGPGFLDAPYARDRMQDLVNRMASRVFRGRETRLDLVGNLGAKDKPLGIFYGGGAP